MATIYLEKLQIPEGFEELLHDLIKEILRDQPENLIKYCFEYFKAKKTNKKMKGDFEMNEFGKNREIEIEKQLISDKGDGVQSAEVSHKKDLLKENMEIKNRKPDTKGTLTEVATFIGEDRRNTNEVLRDTGSTIMKEKTNRIYNEYEIEQ